MTQPLETNENKQLLWGILMEEGVFKGLSGSMLPTIQAVFENTIQEIKKASPAGTPLKILNMSVIQRLAREIPQFSRNAGQVPSTQPHISPIELIYADDIHKHKQSELETRLRQQENDMKSFLDRPKPEEIDFSDELYDKPLGDDMERIINETLAARERDLEMISRSIKPPVSSSSSTTTTAMMAATQPVSIMKTPVTPSTFIQKTQPQAMTAIELSSRDEYILSSPRESSLPRDQQQQPQQQQQQQKSVSFSDIVTTTEINEDDSILQRFKRISQPQQQQPAISGTNDQIIQFLQEIQKTQYIILKEIRSLHEEIFPSNDNPVNIPDPEYTDLSQQIQHVHDTQNAED